MLLTAWAPGVDQSFGDHAPALDRSQVTEVERLIQSTCSVFLSGSFPAEGPAVARARAVVEALGGEIDDPEVRRASGRVLMKHARAVDVSGTASGRFPRGF